jgi:branched-chain amino acid transport system substrate-binding protein
MKKAAAAAALAAGLGALALAAAAVATNGPSTSAAPAAAQASCGSATVGVLAPLTGPAAFLGQEQLSWARFALSRFNTQYGTRYKIRQGDSQLSAALARTVARQFVSNRDIVGVVGGSTSQSVISSGTLFKQAAMAAVSGSATRTDLTSGKYPTFFRVVPHDGIQAPSIANYVKSTLRARRVVIIDSQDDYSTALAAGLVARFKRMGVSYSRESVAADETDFSTIATKIRNDVQAVIFATQTASAAHALSQQLLAQGKRAPVFGTDGAYSPSQYKPRLGYVSSFANDLHFVPAARATVAAYNRFSKNKTFGTFGPPSYMATWIILDAIRKSCGDGVVTRPEVVRWVKATNVPSILGGNIIFTSKGDVQGAKFYIFKVTNGKYALVG